MMSRGTWTQKVTNAALMKPVVAKPTVEEEDENEGPLSKNKARRMRKQLLHREDESHFKRPFSAAGDVTGGDRCRSRKLAHYKGVSWRDR